MANREFAAWCDLATAKIRYGPDREAVSAELHAHLEDKYDALTAKGLPPEEAAEKALESMGSAQEIAPQLGKIHRPWLGYIYSVTQIIALPLCAFVVFALGHHLLMSLGLIIDPDGVGLTVDPPPGAAVYHQEQDAYVFADGYYVQVVQSILIPEQESLYFQTKAIYGSWMNGFSALDHVWGVDDLGNYYSSAAEYERLPKSIVNYGGMVASYGLQVSNWRIVGFDTRAKWLELHYDRDGRDIVLRIELRGGAARG